MSITHRRINNDAPYRLSVAIFVLILASCHHASVLYSGRNSLPRSVQVTLPDQELNMIKTSWPSMACWFWTAAEFTPDGYKSFIELYSQHSPFSLLTTSLRYPGELTDPRVHDQIKAASEYAREKGLRIVMDLDVRLARKVFSDRYAGELQQILLLREFPLEEGDATTITVKSPRFEDHYTYGRNAYEPVGTKLLRVYSYKKGNGLIEVGSLADITKACRSIDNKLELQVTVSGESHETGRIACALIAVTLNTPDVFAPHLLSYQREILMQYADASLAGACKDEWGFPGRFRPSKEDLWYSPSMAAAYEKERPDRELLRDMLLMSVGIEGQEKTRTAAINHYMKMFWQRNGEIENDFYTAVKEIYGKDAIVGTHPTWYPYPNEKEVFKNGLSWWATKRDLAQTDEGTPYAARTALAKKAGSPLWYNMYYDKSIAAYQREIWISALGGGRLNYHPLWPRPMDKLSASLIDEKLMRAESRVQLLNYISSAPVDCPVAVIFGHPSALNWTNEKTFADVGLRVTNALWEQGFYADLIPSSEIANGSLKINADGKIQYGPQVYEAVLLYHPEYEDERLADFFMKVAKNDKTSLYRMGSWTQDFGGQVFDGNGRLPAAMRFFSDEASCSDAIIRQLKAQGIARQATSEMREVSGFPASMMPRPYGRIRLLDGTVILVAAENDVMGDPIKKSIQIDGRSVDFDAVGVAAVRLDKSGNLEALACGGLKSFSVGTFNITLPERMDIALFKEKNGWRGIVHGYKREMPEALVQITEDWTYVVI